MARNTRLELERHNGYLCQRTFLHWESLSAYTSMAYMCFEYADYGSDGTGD